MDWGIYIHIPFCRQKCYYCDFPSFAGRERYINSYVDALCSEIRSRGILHYYNIGSEGFFTSKAKTCYIGGGTPTVLKASEILKIIGEVKNLLKADAEFTVECNPGTVDEKYLLALYQAGVNRLSFGVQSFNDEILARIGRIHKAGDAIKAIDTAKKIGFNNISLDLMYGLPRQSMKDLQESIYKAAECEVKHISIYGLQIEKGTVFARLADENKLMLPSEELVEKMYDYMLKELPKLGYSRYEISNFAKAGYESRHNLSYWQDVPYLGFGSAAHSYIDGVRYSANSDIKKYIDGIKTNNYAVEVEEKYSRKAHIEEFCFLALRTTAGIDKEKFKRVFKQNIEEIFGKVIAEQKNKQLLAENEKNIYLTPLGMKYGNEVFSEFLL